MVKNYLTFAPNLSNYFTTTMKKYLFIILVLININPIFSQNSLLRNSNFETTTWPELAWMSYSNTGTQLIVNENKHEFLSLGVEANSGSHFAFIGGVQNVKGEYEGSLAQEFVVITDGIGELSFFYRYIRESADAGSYIQILIDGSVVWTLAPHFIVDASDEYVEVNVNLGYLSAGTHTFELKGYEFPVGGDLPMKFAFDDISLTTTTTASIELTPNTPIKTTIQGNTLQIFSDLNLNDEVTIAIMDLSGKNILSKQIPYSTNMYVEKPNTSTGVYIVSLHTNNQRYTQKVFFN